MKPTKSLLALAALLASLQLGSAADITGKITLKGNPPPEKPLPLDPTCAKMHEKIPTTRFYVTGDGGELADVFVYLKEGAPKASAPPAESALIDQKGCEYVPYISGLQTKQKLSIRNSDPVLHTVHPTPDPKKTGNKEVNKSQMAKSPDLAFTFDDPEVLLRFKCDVHPWMFAYIGVLDHPYFTVTGKDGSFKIANVPPGKYVVEAYHRKAGKQTANITVEGESKKADFTFEVKAE